MDFPSFSRRERISKKWVIFLAVLLPLSFALFTQHIWEDYFITYRISRNLVEGNGLVFVPGERLHTFTSPLGVLIPALCCWITGVTHDFAAIWLFRIINLGFLAAAARLAWNRMTALGLGPVGRTLFFGLVIADGKLADFATNGMETAILVYFTLLLWSELERADGRRIWVLAGACAGLEWTRPDAFIIAGAILLPHLVFGRKAAGGSPLPLAALATSLTLAVLLYLPWFIWAWWYYGTPVPHTIIAKAQFMAPVNLSHILATPWQTLLGQNSTLDLFMPTYWHFDDWPPVLVQFARFAVVLASFAWVLPGLPARARRLSFSVFLGTFYLSSITVFPWYLPAWSVLAALALSFAVDAAVGYAGRSPRRAPLLLVLRMATAVAIGLQALMFCASAWEMRIQQRTIEDHGRREIGQWLRAHARPRDTVFLEPLGYIGYYSGLKAYDVPGLSSREVVAVVKAGQRRFAEIITALHPTWLVLRPFEFADPKQARNAYLRNYESVRQWDATGELAAIDWLPGRGLLDYDTVFTVYRLKAGANP